MSRPSRRRPGLVWTLLAFAALIQVLLAWFPFGLDPPRLVTDAVTRTPDGLRLDGARVVAEADPPWTAGTLADLPWVRIRVTVRPATLDQTGPARILAVSEDVVAANLVVGQERDDLVVRVRRPGSSPGGTPPMEVAGVFAVERWTDVEVDVTRERAVVRVDGEVAGTQEFSSTPFPHWDPAYRLRVGDERVGARPWRGLLRTAEVATPRGAIDYTEPGRLEIARRAWYVPDRLREALEPPGRQALARLVAHLVAFVPVGALMLASGARPWHTVRGVALTTLGFGLALQVGKLVFADRHPSLLTVVAQVLGALAGAALLAAWRRREVTADDPARAEASAEHGR